MTQIYPRKSILVIHIGTSVGFLGAVAVFFCLAVFGLTADNPLAASTFYFVMPAITWWIIVPLALASLFIGIAQAAVSPWGLVRHYWVVVKLVMTVGITGVLLMQLQTVNRLGSIGVSIFDEAHLQARYSVLLHSGGGMLAIVAVLILSIAKPAGRTGWMST